MIVKKKIKDKDLQNLYLRIGRLLNAGISLKKAIEFQKNSSKNPILKSKILNFCERLEKGENIYSILKDENLLKERELLIIYVSENIGRMGDGFLKISKMKEKKEKLNNEIKIALSYPIFILVISTIIILFIFYFIVPNFESVYSLNQNELPLITKFILKIKYILSKYPYTIPIYICVVFFGLKSEKIKKLLYKNSLIRKFLIEKYIISILDNLALLLESGISIDKAVDIILENLDKGFFRNRIYILKNIKKGEVLSSCLKKLEVFSLEEIDMVKIGEESGTVPLILKEIALVREEELNKRIKIILKLIEPILLLIIGVIISIFVVGLYLPILNMGDLLEI
ncbi:MAG: type II secretion system F family protein [Cetobacterium sp.]